MNTNYDDFDDDRKITRNFFNVPEKFTKKISDTSHINLTLVENINRHLTQGLGKDGQTRLTTEQKDFLRERIDGLKYDMRRADDEYQDNQQSPVKDAEQTRFITKASHAADFVRDLHEAGIFRAAGPETAHLMAECIGRSQGQKADRFMHHVREDTREQAMRDVRSALLRPDGHANTQVHIQKMWQETKEARTERLQAQRERFLSEKHGIPPQGDGMQQQEQQNTNTRRRKKGRRPGI